VKVLDSFNVRVVQVRVWIMALESVPHAMERAKKSVLLVKEKGKLA